MTPVLRTGGRVLLLDGRNRVLLIHERLAPASPLTHWLTPGGGLEPGESPLDAAVREAFEETGIVVEPEADAVLVTQRRWNDAAGTVYDQTDHFFLARVRPGARVAPRALTDAEARTLIGHRWWPAAELRATTDTIVPAHLVDVLTSLGLVSA